MLGAAFRYDIGLPDGFFATEREDLQKVVQVVRWHRPKLVITNAIRDRMPDHGRGAELVARACFLSGLRRMETHDGRRSRSRGGPPPCCMPFRTTRSSPDLVVDVTPFWERRAAALMCFRSQFYDPTSTEPESPIASSDFLPSWKAVCARSVALFTPPTAKASRLPVRGEGPHGPELSGHWPATPLPSAVIRRSPRSRYALRVCRTDGSKALSFRQADRKAFA